MTGKISKELCGWGRRRPDLGIESQRRGSFSQAHVGNRCRVKHGQLCQFIHKFGNSFERPCSGDFPFQIFKEAHGDLLGRFG
jgi:hypothetical protein